MSICYDMEMWSPFIYPAFALRLKSGINCLKTKENPWWCPRETFVNTFMLQIAVLANHLNGRDTHVRQIKIYGPRPWVKVLLCLPYMNIISRATSNILLLNLLQESHPAPTFSIHIDRVHNILYFEMNELYEPWYMMLAEDHWSCI